MPVALNLELPDGAFSAMRKDPEEFVREMRLAAAVKWYEMTLLSQEKAAEIAGLSRIDFITSLSRFGVSPFQYSASDVLREAADAK